MTGDKVRSQKTIFYLPVKCLPFGLALFLFLSPEVNDNGDDDGNDDQEDDNDDCRNGSRRKGGRGGIGVGTQL